MVSKVGLEESEVLFILTNLNANDVVDISVSFDIAYSNADDGLDSTIATGTLATNTPNALSYFGPLNTFASAISLAIMPEGAGLTHVVASRP
jgi:hypothetical protein